MQKLMCDHFVFAWFAGIPGPHVASRNNRPLRVEDANQRLGILRDDALDELAHIERYHEAPSDVILVTESC
jgi:hypothetical protein